MADATNRLRALVVSVGSTGPVGLLGRRGGGAGLSRGAVEGTFPSPAGSPGAARSLPLVV